MNPEFSILTLTAFSIGMLHTVLGPDHYLPVAAIARSGRWSARKTFWITALCGLGHVFGSVFIGSIGLVLGTMLIHLQAVESLRSEWAAYLLISFGLTYLIWGIIRANGVVGHSHLHSPGETVDPQLKNRDAESDGISQTDGIDCGNAGVNPSITPWVLFLIFVFGPCEALIPLMMYTAADSNLLAIAAVVLSFAAATIGTMLAMVMLVHYGLRLVEFPDLRRFGHAIAGLGILVCGLLVKFGW